MQKTPRQDPPLGFRKEMLVVTTPPFYSSTPSGKTYIHVGVRCDCGTEKVMLKDNFLKPGVKSCGCHSIKLVKARNAASLEDLTGKRFGKLTVISYLGYGEDGQSYFLCKCACGRDLFL